jgi:hypothetical protein
LNSSVNERRVLAGFSSITDMGYLLFEVTSQVGDPQAQLNGS